MFSFHCSHHLQHFSQMIALGSYTGLRMTNIQWHPRIAADILSGFLGVINEVMVFNFCCICCFLHTTQEKKLRGVRSGEQGGQPHNWPDCDSSSGRIKKLSSTGVVYSLLLLPTLLYAQGLELQTSDPGVIPMGASFALSTIIIKTPSLTSQTDH